VTDVFGAVRGVLSRRVQLVGETGGSATTQAENIKYFEQHVVSEFTVRTLSGWTVASRHSLRNLEHAYI
jgi:hypothetical protein